MKGFLCRSNEIAEGQCKAFSLEQNNLLLLRRKTTIYAYANRCPHIGTPLNWLPDQFMDSENEFIQCSTHGALFIPETGECISGPCNGQTLTPIAIFEQDGCISLIQNNPNTSSH